jgi:hypothetical protein
MCLKNKAVGFRNFINGELDTAGRQFAFTIKKILIFG